MKRNNFQYPGAFVTYANYASFTSGKTIRLGPVQSRMLLWCKTGKGIITVNDKIYDFRPGDFLFIPWNHMIRYQADKRVPFLVAGIHLIPDYRGFDEIVYGVFHNVEAENPEYPKRQDVYMEEFLDVFSGRLNENSRLFLLAEYIVMWFKNEPRWGYLARSLANTLIYELKLIRTKPENTSLDLPMPLTRIRAYLKQNISLNIDIDTLARVAECSRPTLFRLFLRYFQCTPGNWLWRQKLEHATELLVKSNLRIGEIGLRVGVDDPYYFSRIFKKYYGITAREYRNRNSLTPGIPVQEHTITKITK